MAEAKPPKVEKSESQKLLQESQDSEEGTKGKNLKRNESAAASGMSPLQSSSKKRESDGGSGINRTRSNPRRGSNQQSENSRGSGSRIAKLPKDPKAEKVSPKFNPTTLHVTAQCLNNAL